MAAGAALGETSVERFGMFAKVMAKPGQRDALVANLLEASRLVGALPGCDLYVVTTSAGEPDAVWVAEAWRSEADHDASLKLDSVRTVIARTRPLLAEGSEFIRVTPVGGKGLPSQ